MSQIPENQASPVSFGQRVLGAVIRYGVVAVSGFSSFRHYLADLW